MNLSQRDYIIQRLHNKRLLKSLHQQASAVCARLWLLASPPTARHTIANNRVVLSYRVLATYAFKSRLALPAKGETIFIGGNHTRQAKHREGGHMA